MENITIDSLNNQDEFNDETIKAPLVGRDYVGRTYQKEEPDDHSEVSNGDQSKTKSTFRARFGSKSTHEEKSDILDRGIVARTIPEKSAKKESFESAMKKINEDVSLKDRDVALAQLLNKSVNPTKIPDGHCAKCAFNTHLHFIGRDLEEAEGGETDAFVKFSYWFYMNLSPEIVKCVESVEGRVGESYQQYKDRIEERVQANTSAGESVLISIGEGAHWYNAYNDGERIWFVDTQTGKGFNLYGTEPSDFNAETAWVDIVKVAPEQVDDYDTL
ncbi:MAG: hypothetical protein KFB93_07205 [Simkaniaceae bacterium]|nr:MAG: hypothetical protein KFB93_07205 [Simkaniaceae bacterium]